MERGHRVFGQLNISIFNFSLALNVGARSAVSLWLTIVDSFIADLSVPPPWYPILPRSLSISLSLSLYLVSSTSSLTLWPGRFGLFVASIFFVVFHFEQPRFTPIDNPAIRITLENRTDTKQLFNAAYCGFGLSLCWNTPESRLSERLLYEVTVSSIILLSLNGESQPSTGEINSPSRGPAIIRGSFHRMEKRGAAMKSYDSFGDGYTRSKNDLKKRKGNKR